MNTEKRREILMKRLREAKQPLTGTKLARELGVSRQIIVGDISILRAEGTQIFATPRGYIMPQEAGDKSIKATIVCHHDATAMEKELQAVVDNGGSVLDVIVEHPVYGEMTAPLRLSSRAGVEVFMRHFESGETSPISQLTGGVHLHTVEAPDEQTMERILTALREKGYLVE